MSLSVTQIPVVGLDSNFSYLITDTTTNQTLIIDPSGEIERVFTQITTAALEPTAILITHSHFDHIDKLTVCLEQYPVVVYIHQSGRGKLPVGNIEALPPEGITLGSNHISVLETPGHSDDAVCFYIAAEYADDGIPKLITGDTLFVEGCGRTTKAQVRQLYDSLQTLKTYPPKTTIYPGHDYGSMPQSTLAHELLHNRFMRAAAFATFSTLRLG